MSMDDLHSKAHNIRLVAFDIDGIMTDGRLYFTSLGDEIKAFNVKDGLGLNLLRKSGVEVAIITGRTSELVSRRARDLKIDKLVQGREDKKIALEELMQRENLTADQIAYMGDDLPDLPAIRYAGLGVTVADALPIVKQHADFITEAKGGEGAVREFCDWLLQAQGNLDQVLEPYLR
ncbi:MAG: HAD-IIIA family hydrolase [Pseudomonadota bacterium]|nr:HAD-IIIA family hydrolase [Pseudomonadota bacterium]